MDQYEETDFISIPEAIRVLPEIQKIVDVDLNSNDPYDNSDKNLNNDREVLKLNNSKNSEFSNNTHRNIQIKNKKSEVEQIELKKTQAKTFEKYVHDTGISSAFQLILAELISKKIPAENHFRYTAGRLRSIGREINELKLKNK